MDLGIGISLTRPMGGGGEPPIIGVSVFPTTQPVTDGESWADLFLASATQTSNYSSSEGTISSVTAEVRIDGGTWTALSGNEANVLSTGETAETRVTVSDGTNSRVFLGGAETVAVDPGDIPVLDTAPDITGTVQEGEEVTIVRGTYTGLQPISYARSLTLGGTDVTKDIAFEADTPSIITTLFSGNKVGYFVDAYKASTVLSNAMADTPAGDGDTVEEWTGSSGSTNAVDHIQPNAAKRPTFKSDGTQRWVEGDGAATYLLSSADLDLTGETVLNVSVAIRAEAPDFLNNHVPFSFTNNVGSQPSIVIFAPRTFHTVGGIVHFGNARSYGTTDPAYNPPRDMVVTVIVDVVAELAEIRVDGVQVATRGSFGNSLDVGAEVAYLLGLGDAGWFKGRMYAAAAVPGVLTVGELDDLEAAMQTRIDGDVSGTLTYSIPSAVAGQSLVYEETASNIVGTAATETVTKTVTAAPSGLLDTYSSGALFAYAPRRLAAATTNSIRVRRASDNGERDLTPEEVTDGTLAAFCGASSGFVHTFYDQTGNGNDAVQTVAGQQARIYDGTSVDTLGGHPAAIFDESRSVSYVLPSGSYLFSNAPNKCFYSVARAVAGGGGFYRTLYLGNAGSSNITHRFSSGGPEVMTLNGFSNSLDYNGFGIGTTIMSWGEDFAGRQEVRENDIFRLTNNNGGQNVSNEARLGGYLNNNFWEGPIAELVGWTGDQSANRSGIHAEVMGAYGL